MEDKLVHVTEEAEISVVPVTLAEEEKASLISRFVGWLDDNAPSELMQVWFDELSPLMSPGGRPAAIILALGAASVPLQLSGSVIVAPILATGAVCVAILSVV